MSIRIPFSKSTVFKIYRFQNLPFSKSTIFKMCCKNVPSLCGQEAYPSHFHSFQNVLVLCECSLRQAISSRITSIIVQSLKLKQDNLKDSNFREKELTVVAATRLGCVITIDLPSAVHPASCKYYVQTDLEYEHQGSNEK